LFKDAFQPLKNVSDLQIAFNPDTNLDELAVALENGGWKEKKNFLKLVLSFNQLTFVPRNVLQAVSEELYQLDLSSNNFASIRMNSFPRLKNIEVYIYIAEAKHTILDIM
jgi:Leucine-rich repeat (LRR) protein